MSEQLLLGFPERRSFARADFLVADSNREAAQWIDRWPDWPGPALVLVGPAGCGKTHLATVWQQKSGGRLVAAPALATAAALDPALMAAAVEDAPAGLDETALFHLYNGLAERRGHLLITAETPPARWELDLADLRSRLLTAPLAAIAAPEDDLLAAVLVKLFADRQVEVEPEVISYLVTRVERSLAAVAQMVALLDTRALAEKRAITVPLAHRLLAEAAAGQGDA